MVSWYYSFFSIRGSGRQENLSKYVSVLSYEKYAPKLQKKWNIRKRNNKKIKKKRFFADFNEKR